MKNFCIYFLYLLMILSSCAKEDVIPVAGMWASVNEDNSVAKLIEFSKGAFIEYTPKKDTKFYYHDEKVWHATKKDFDVIKYPYSIEDQKLILDDSKTQTTISVTQEKLYIGSSEYHLLRELDITYGSSILLLENESNTKVCTPYAQTVKLDYVISNIPPNTLLHVSCDAEWVNTISIDETHVSFNLEENLTSGIRNAKMKLSHPAADTVEINLVQSVSQLTISSSLTRTDYLENEFEFAYSIESPIAGQEVEISCRSDWIKDITIRDNRVYFTVLENNSGVSRSANIELRYGAISTFHKVEQSYVAPEIILSETSTTITSFGASHSFSYMIVNPRSISEVKLSCTEEWIENLAVKGEEVSFDILENNTGAGRIADIVLQYFTTQSIFRVVQSYTSLEVIRINLDDDAQSTTMTWNASRKWSAHSYDDWLRISPESGDNDAELTISVSENYSNKERVGMIIVSDDKVDKIIEVHQLGKYFSINVDNSTFSSKEQVLDISISTNDIWNIVMPDRVDWVTFDKVQGNGDESIKATIRDNASIVSRECKVSIKPDNLPGVEFTIVQNGKYLNVNPTELVFPALGGTSEVISIDTDGDVDIKKSCDWIQIDKITENSFMISPLRNKSTEPRSGVVTVSLSGLTDGAECAVDIIVNQKGVSEVFDGSDYPSDEDWN